MFEDLRIGLTMRNSDACNYQEARDGIACSWFDFLAHALPGCIAVPLPNIGSNVVHTASKLGLNAFILTGGESLGLYKQRDESEISLISYALKRKIPVMGICRGMQMLHTYFNGRLVSCLKAEHVAVRHKVFFTHGILGSVEKQTVNSYHTNGIESDTLPSEMRPFAVDSSGLVEGIYSPMHRLAGVMWHPEREQPFAQYDVAIFRKFLSN